MTFRLDEGRQAPHSYSGWHRHYADHVDGGPPFVDRPRIYVELLRAGRPEAAFLPELNERHGGAPQDSL